MEDVVAPVLQRKDTPPAAVNVAEPPGQITKVGHVIAHGGAGLTVTVVEQVLVQPLAVVTVTVYVVVEAGLTVIEAVVAPVLHRNDAPPDTERVTEPPTQIDGLDGVIVHGACWLTVTVVEHELVHPFASVTVTVYVVAVVGFTVMAAVVAPVLQRKDTPPDAVSVVEPPTQMDGLEGVMTQVGGGFTITVTEQDDVHPLSASVTVTV